MLETPHRVSDGATPVRAARFQLSSLDGANHAAHRQVDVASALWEGRNKIIGSLIAVLFAAGAYLGLFAEREYTARAHVRIILAPGAAASDVEQRTGISGRKSELETEKAIILSTRVITATAERLKVEESVLRDTLRARLEPGTFVITVTAHAETGEGAATTASTLVDTYIAQQVATKEAKHHAAVQTLRTQLNAQTDALETAKSSLANLKQSSDLVSDAQLTGQLEQLKGLRLRLRRMRAQQLPEHRIRQVSSLAQAVNVLEQRLEQHQSDKKLLHSLTNDVAVLAKTVGDTRAELAKLDALTGTARAHAQSLGPVDIPTRPSAPRKGFVLSTATVTGLLLGMVWALWAGLRYGGMRLTDEVEAATDLAVLAEIPEVSGRLSYHLDSPAKSPFRAAFTRLRLAISLNGPRRQVIAMAAPAPDCGQGWALLGLAQALGSERSVIVIDADMHQPTLAHQLDGLPAPYGLAAHILGLAQEDEIILPYPDYGFDLVPGEMLDSDPETLLSSHEFRNFVDRMRAKYDIVLLNLPPVLACNDARILADHADALFLCVRWDRTRAEDAKAALAELQDLGAPTLGSILTRQKVDPAPSYPGYVRWNGNHTRIEIGN